MSEILRSVGLDVGTTSTQLILSRLTVKNQASSFSVPKMEITGREILYESPVHFTPLLGENLVDGEKIRALVTREYENAGITRAQVDTGALERPVLCNAGTKNHQILLFANVNINGAAAHAGKVTAEGHISDRVDDIAGFSLIECETAADICSVAAHKGV